MPDDLMQYCLALDGCDFALLESVLQKARDDYDLETEILVLHLRFDSNESWAAQLQAERDRRAQSARCTSE